MPSLMQLVAYGAQDVYLSASPIITTTYRNRRFANYALDTLPLPINTSVPEPNIIYKLLTENTECIITYIIIETNDAYWECDTCKKVVSWDAALLWIGGHKNCPHCRCDANFDNKYINAQKPDVIKKKQKKQKKIVNGANRTTNKYQSQQYQKNIKAQFKNGRY